MPVRIGFIGTGGIANTHFNTLSQIPDAQLVAFCDLATQRAEDAARRFEGKAYTRPAAMLENEKLDAVYICLPPHAHKDAEILAVEAGCALFVEKPLANNLKTAETIAGAVENSGVLTSVGYHFRYHEATDRTLKLLSGKGASAPSMLEGRWLGGHPGVAWWRNYKLSGGQLVEQATHIIDLARYVAGDIKKVYCAAALREMDKVFEGATAPDVTALTVEFESGAVGNMATTSMLGGWSETGLRIMAKDAVYELDGNTLTVRQSGETHVFPHRNNPYLTEDQIFIRAIKTGKRAEIRSNYADALKTLRVTLAANQSAKTGKPVKI